MVNEEAIQLALEELRSQEVQNYTELAKKYNTDRRTLARRHKGKTIAFSEAISRHPKKTDKFARKDSSSAYILSYCYKDRVKGVYLCAIDSKRKIADNSLYFELFCNHLNEIIKKYNIEPSNIYNFDEKGFLIGLGNCTKQIVPSESLRSGKITAIQDGNQEFISLQAAISADGTSIPPALIYKRGGDIQNSWLDEYNPDEETAYFASSPTGWSSDDFGLTWLEQIFDHHTKAKAGRGRRLLILHGYSSHINMRYVDYTDNNRILLAVLPPHSTHHLQPLDVGLFSPLSTAYSQEADNLICKGYGWLSLTKHNFWKLFHGAWNKSFTAENIAAGFAATGIYPFNPNKLLNNFKKRSITHPTTIIQPLTPTTARGLHREIKKVHLCQSLLSENIEKIIHASERLVVEKELLRHKN
ncbi:conserved hypothetical protein [Coccidioides posadasii str. Silveira]|uniref:DDE-1 domain-containing protein n=1 Tax=Coccidioides posadasii (strain RMSCC 757 / Silveira) TaxID=443226 RepID=E9DF88_COCPS|nr:conserved hypothetical protein [Coccidioides posadasii str. Silveira]